MRQGFARRLPFFSQRGDFIKTYPSLFEDTGGEPLAPGYSKFLKDYNWMHIVSTLANDDFLKMETILDSNVGDVFSYLCYLTAKGQAEREQRKFVEKLKIN